MEISRHNYEHYFLDFIEGKLSSEEEDILRAFLQSNPDLAEELKSYELFDISENQLVFPGKSLLKKHFPHEDEAVDDQNFEMFSIAYLEDDVSEKQRASFEKYIQDQPKKAKEYKTLKSTILHPETFVFPNKESLKRRKPIVIRLASVVSLSAAAAVALFFIFGPRTNEPAIQISETIPGSKVIEELVEESPKEKPVKKSTSATIKVIRNSKNPVPVSNFKKEVSDQKNNTQSNTQTDNRKRIASVNLNNAALREVNAKYDRLIPVPLMPTSISRSSLSMIEQARYDYKRAAKMAEEEDVFIWNLASNGIKELNRLTGSEMKLLASKNQEGDISGISFKSRYLQLTTPIVREEE